MTWLLTWLWPDCDLTVTWLSKHVEKSVGLYPLYYRQVNRRSFYTVSIRGWVVLPSPEILQHLNMTCGAFLKRPIHLPQAPSVLILVGALHQRSWVACGKFCTTTPLPDFGCLPEILHHLSIASFQKRIYRKVETTILRLGGMGDSPFSFHAITL